MQRIKIEHITPIYYDISKGYYTEDNINERVVELFKVQLHKAIEDLTFDDFISRENNRDGYGVHFETRVLISTGKNGQE